MSSERPCKAIEDRKVIAEVFIDLWVDEDSETPYERKKSLYVNLVRYNESAMVWRL